MLMMIQKEHEKARDNRVSVQIILLYARVVIQPIIVLNNNIAEFIQQKYTGLITYHHRTNIM